MKYDVRCEKFKLTSANNNYLEEKISKLDKYFKDENTKVQVNIKVKGKSQKIEVTIPYNKHFLRSEETCDDLYAAIDKVIDKVERQIRKNKSKIKKQLKENSEVFDFNYEELKEDEEKKKVVKKKKLEMKPMDVKEAMLELELLDHDFFIYKDVKTDNINVLYKRHDGNYGIIETNPEN